jgi:hypothetical protein
MTHFEQSKVHVTNNLESAFKRNRRFTIGSQTFNVIGGAVINRYSNGTLTIIKQDISPAEKSKLIQATQSLSQGNESASRGAESEFKCAILQDVQSALLDAQSELKDAQAELKDAQAELKDVHAELKDTQAEIKDAQSIF